MNHVMILGLASGACAGSALVGAISLARGTTNVITLVLTWICIVLLFMNLGLLAVAVVRLAEASHVN